MVTSRGSGARTAITAMAVVFSLVATACSRPSAGLHDEASGADTWRTATLTDVLTGAEFRIDDLKGKVVAIEMMAIWCVSCRRQQSEARTAIDQVDSTNLVYVSLDVDPFERDEDLRAYARHEGFDWHFVVAARDVSRSLAATFGDGVLSPPATPLVVLGPDGEVIEKHFGVLPARELASLFKRNLP